MLRFALSAVALVGVLAVAQPVFADPLTATASDYAQTAADAIEQPAWSWSSDAPASADVLVEPVGNAVSQGSGGMSFLVAGGVLLLALLAGIVLDSSTVSASGNRKHDGTFPTSDGCERGVCRQRDFPVVTRN